MKNSIKHFSLFFLGNIIPQIANFLLLPLYANDMGSSEYGILQTVTVLQSILTISMSLAVERSIFRIYLDYPPEEKSSFLGSVYLFSILNGFVLMVLVSVLGYFFSNTLFPGISFYPTIFLVIASSYFFTTGLSVKNYFIMEKRASLFFILTICQFLLETSLRIVLIKVFHLGANGQLSANALIGIIFAPAFFYYAVKNFKLVWKSQYLKSALKFSIPFIPSLLAAFVMNYFDRLFLQRYFLPQEVGVYAVGQKIASMVPLVVISLQQSYSPDFFRKYVAITKRNENLQKRSSLILMMVGLVSFVIALFSKELISVFFKPEYTSAGMVIPILVLGYFYNGLASLAGLSINAEKKNWIVTIILLFSMGVNFILNAILVPAFGMLGASFATTGSFITYGVLVWIVTKWNKWPSVSMLSFVGLSFVIIMVIVLSYFTANASFYLIIAIKVLICLFILSVLIVKRHEILSFIKPKSD